MAYFLKLCKFSAPAALIGMNLLDMSENEEKNGITLTSVIRDCCCLLINTVKEKARNLLRRVNFCFIENFGMVEVYSI